MNNTRLTEMSAAICAQRVIKELHELAIDPSGKRFAASASSRKSKWAELVTIAEKQLQSFAESEPPPVKVIEGTPVTPATP